jgi:hypothetical protein
LHLISLLYLIAKTDAISDGFVCSPRCARCKQRDASAIECVIEHVPVRFKHDAKEGLRLPAKRPDRVPGWGAERALAAKSGQSSARAENFGDLLAEPPFGPDRGF